MFIKKPGKSNPRFRLMERQSNGSSVVTIHNPELDSINADYRAGTLSLERAHALVKELRKRLTKPKPTSFLPENFQIVEDYWNEIGSQKEIRRPEEAKRRLLWGIKQIGSLSILVASSQELRNSLSHLSSPNDRRRAINVINALCKFKKLDKWLQPPKGRRPTPEFLTFDEVTTLVATPSLLTAPEVLCIWAALATGCRTGELFDLHIGSYRFEGTHVYVESQRLFDWRREVTKNEKIGTVFVVPELRDKLREWINVDLETKIKMRRMRQPGKKFAIACEKILGRALTFHNLRHSYAKLMLSRGASLEDLRKWLRDRISTIEDYYVSWVETSTEMGNNVKRFG